MIFPGTSAAWAFLYFILFLPLIITIHESGHGVMCRLAGGTLRGINVGLGKELFSFRLFGLPFRFRESFRGGYCSGYFLTEDRMRLRYFWYVLGGPLANLLVAGIVWLALGMPRLYPFGRGALGDPGFLFLLLNLGIGLFNLIPYMTRGATSLGSKNPTDGMLLLQIPFWKSEKVKQVMFARELLAASDAVRAGKWDEAERLYRLVAEALPENVPIQFGLAGLELAQMKLGECEARTATVESMDEKKELQVYLHNLKSMLLLVRGDDDGALAEAREAFSIEPNNPFFKVSLGACLVVNDELEKGLKFLKPALKESRTNAELFFPHLFIAVALDKLGKQDKSVPHKRWLVRNQEVYSPFDQEIWARFAPDSFPSDLTKEI